MGCSRLSVGLLVARGVLIDELGSSTDYEVIGSIWDVLVSRLYWAIGGGFVVCLAVLVIVVLTRSKARIGG